MTLITQNSTGGKYKPEDFVAYAIKMQENHEAAILQNGIVILGEGLYCLNTFKYLVNKLVNIRDISNKIKQ